jgi:hypothetical protein
MLARPRSRWFGCCIRPNRGALDEGGGRRLRHRQSAVRARCPPSRLTAAQMLRTRLLATVAPAAHHPTARPPARSAEIQRRPGRR